MIYLFVFFTQRKGWCNRNGLIFSLLCSLAYLFSIIVFIFYYFSFAVLFSLLHQWNMKRKDWKMGQYAKKNQTVVSPFNVEYIKTLHFPFFFKKVHNPLLFYSKTLSSLISRYSLLLFKPLSSNSILVVLFATSTPFITKIHTLLSSSHLYNHFN